MSRSRFRSRLFGIAVPVWLSLAVAAATAGGCASGSEGTTSDSAPTESEASGETSAAEADESREFGDDPMGVAQQWAAELPGVAPDEFADRASDWEEPVVARLYRTQAGAYRGVVLPRDEGDARGFLLRIEETDAGWEVVSVETTEGDHGWTTY